MNAREREKNGSINFYRFSWSDKDEKERKKKKTKECTQQETSAGSISIAATFLCNTRRRIRITQKSLKHVEGLKGEASHV